MNAIELRDALNEKIEQGLGEFEVRMEGCDGCWQEPRMIGRYDNETLLITNVDRAELYGENAWKQ